MTDQGHWETEEEVRAAYNLEQNDDLYDICGCAAIFLRKSTDVVLSQTPKGEK